MQFIGFSIHGIENLSNYSINSLWEASCKQFIVMIEHNDER